MAIPIAITMLLGSQHSKDTAHLAFCPIAFWYLDHGFLKEKKNFLRLIYYSLAPFLAVYVGKSNL